MRMREFARGSTTGTLGLVLPPNRTAELSPSRLAICRRGRRTCPMPAHHCSGWRLGGAGGPPHPNPETGRCESGSGRSWTSGQGLGSERRIMHRRPSAGRVFWVQVVVAGSILAVCEAGEMARIPPGSFVMGSASNTLDALSTEMPQTKVTLTYEFWMGKHEVTQGEYLALMGENPSMVKGNLARPVENISWMEAMMYCAMLNEGTEPPLSSPAQGYIYRLPTEAEWEYACRAGSVSRFSYGDDLDYSQFAANGYCILNSRYVYVGVIMGVPWYTWETSPVGQKPANAWGLFDMHGNVWEFCLDGYIRYPGGSLTDPFPNHNGYRIVRGGSVGQWPKDCRSATRAFVASKTEPNGSDCGFRVVYGPDLSRHVEVTTHRVGEEALVWTPDDDIDDPLAVKSDPALLREQLDLGQGVVADGVTPVLFRLVAPKLTATTSYRIVSYALLGFGIDFEPQLWVLTTNGFEKGSSVTMSADVREAFVYLEGIDREEMLESWPEGELSFELVAPDEVTEATVKVRVRKPPVVLVHGLGAKRDEFTDYFLDFFRIYRPEDFIHRTEYGVNNGDPLPNRTGSLWECAEMLSAALEREVEAPDSPLRSEWAFTRYDIVGHSQGGVILRLLCQNEIFYQPIEWQSFRRAANQYRGRFDRVITIGSPHNGSMGQFYMDTMLKSGWFIVDTAAPWIVYGPGNEKFDPSGWEIRTLADGFYTPDPKARFHCIATLIGEGKPPTPDIPVYDGSGLSRTLNATPVDTLRAWHSAVWRGVGTPDPPIRRGHFIFPEGSDGVVDFRSQLGGCVGNVSELTPTSGFPNTAHLSKLPSRLRFGGADRPVWDFWGLNLYGIEPHASQVDSADVAQAIAGLLNGTRTNVFGPFLNPALLTENQLEVIRGALLAEVTLFRGIEVIIPLPFGVPPPAGAGGGGESLSFGLVSPEDEPILEPVTWLAVLYGTNGIDYGGIPVTVHSNDSRRVTLAIPSDLTGDVALRAQYVNARGESVYVRPKRVYSTDGAAVPATLMLDRTNLTLRAGQRYAFSLLAESDPASPRVIFRDAEDGLTFSTTDPDVVTVRGLGEVEAMAPGVATVTAALGGAQAEAVMVVTPANDEMFLPLPLESQAIRASNVNASKETGEPDHAGVLGGSSVWFSWLASAGGPVDIEISEAGFDTVLAVYRRASGGMLEPVASAVAESGSTGNWTTFDAEEGSTYLVAVDGKEGAQGTFFIRAVTETQLTLRITGFDLDPPRLHLEVNSRLGKTYVFEPSDTIAPSAWKPAPSLAGTGGPLRLTAYIALWKPCFFRVREE